MGTKVLAHAGWRVGLLTLGSMLVLAMPARAAADEKDGGARPEAAEIVVTAQRRAQSVMDVPLAISALGGSGLTSKGVTNSVNLAQAVPNLQVSTNFGAAQPNFSMRGISVANEYNSNQVSPVGVYMDDVYLAARASHGMGLFDLDRVEVLRGPQGTLFGRNTTGGAINFITRAPKLEGTNGYLEAGYGNFNTFTAQGALETTLAQDQVGLRMAVNYVKGDGQFRNLYPGGVNPSSQDTLQGRLSLRIKPTGSGLDIKIRAYAGRDNPTGSATFGLQSARSGLGFFEVNEKNLGLNRTRAWGVAANISYALSSAVTLTSITSYDGGSINMGQNADGAPLDILYINWKSDFRQFAEEARINYSSDRLKLVTGLFYGWDRTITDNNFSIGSALAPGVNGGFFQHFRQARTSIAGFAQADYTLAPRLTLTLGGRYTSDKAQYRDGYAYLFMGGFGAAQTPLATTVPCAGLAGTCAYDPAARFALDGSNNAFTGRAALSYKFDNGLLSYVSYNRGYRSGAFNGGSYTSSAGINYVKPETVNAFEAGLKGRLFDRSLSFSTALFYYDYANQQLQDTRAGPVAFLVNAPKSEVYGAEAEFNWQAARGLSFNGSVGLLHAQYKELTLQGANLAGKDLPFAPHVTAQVGADINLIDSGRDVLTLSPNLAYSGRQYFAPFNLANAPGTGQMNSELQQNGYAKVNAQLLWKHGNYQLRAWVNNALNARVYAYGLDLRGAGFPYNFLVPATPRTFGLSGRVSF
ncbi:TonB-dependent receptor [Novosphingobium sediminicola]|uniref:Outer membrane receptor protein involved in Fe transport n=1 Tax=Novosphingobium sediminicola TaxID=563162 RepID=A0A7W6G9M4_9SPHN|nr:TonB-dependent receptor [Novosphingobium sediminicola]MBB3957207.1 outer membrane receptor protein involved in Fe transport [Novosphingobium sediminicola]